MVAERRNPGEYNMQKLDKCRICRRVGEKLFLKGEKCNLPTCPVTKRPYAPGQAGNKRRMRKGSDYSKQLLEKQKARAIYGVTEKQMANYFELARKTRHSTGLELSKLLENRLDSVVYKAGWASSRREARQMVAHGNIAVNGKISKSPSLQTKTADKVTLKGSKKLEIKKDIPEFIKFSKDQRELEIITSINVEDILSILDIQLIIEFYSR
ncbi:MAG: 30S ribosomal protein S4 [Nanoarchaeota archaeon]|nr:30S ribosomal protein S4 [Nanoarchaeota archaeon]